MLAPFARRDPLRARVVRATSPDRPVLHDVELRGAPRRGGGAGGRERRGQEHDAGPARALPRSGRAGAITFDGTDLRDATVASLRGQLGIVTQETILFHDTVRANIAYGASERPDAGRVEQAARAAHAHEFIVAPAAGLRHRDRRPRRAAVGRRAPAPGDRARPAAQSAHPAAGRGHLVARHRERTPGAGRARAADARAHRAGDRAPALDGAARRSHLVFEGGRIVQQGTHDELVARDGPYRRLHELQFR